MTYRDAFREESDDALVDRASREVGGGVARMAPSASKRGARKAAAAVRGGDKKKRATRGGGARDVCGRGSRAFPPVHPLRRSLRRGRGRPRTPPRTGTTPPTVRRSAVARVPSPGHRASDGVSVAVHRRASRVGDRVWRASTAAVLDALARPVRASNRSVRRNYKGPGGVETWDDEGEPGNRGHLLPVNRLYERVNAGELVVSEPHGPQLIASLAASQHPITSPWGVPLTRCVCVNAPEPSDDLAEADSGAVTLTLACYAGRL